MPQLIPPRVHDLGGGFTVRRLLPQAQRRSVGPFVFFDHIGPAVLGVDNELEVRPHPHIGLATVTYLWEGAIMHRDSVGSVQEILPGDVNWMTAGRGIVHSERTPARLHGVPHPMHGLQTWVALPHAHEETDPAFAHHPAATLPRLDRDGARLHVVAGHGFGEVSPVRVLSGTLYVSIDMEAGARLRLPDEHEERAVYPVAGDVDLDGVALPLAQLAVLEGRGESTLHARTACRLMLLGGEPVGQRYVWWNFVSSRRERIEQAKEDWRAQRMGRVAGETDFIPLPDR
jgi:redox-sensitive bicupin YhaK (pirin superfamily)